MSTEHEARPVLVDGRYRGHHGIARYAREVIPRVLAQVRGNVLDEGTPGTTDFLPLGRQLRRRQPEFFYSPGFYAGWPTSVRQILTVHDLIHLDVQTERTSAKAVYYRHVLRPAARRAGVLFTVSDFSRRRIAEQLGLDPSTIIVTGNGCSPEFLTPAPRRRADRPYVLCVTNGKPHKNFGLIARAADMLPADLTVTCVGISPAVATPIIPSRSRERFTFLGGLSDGELRALYAGAATLALPSVMEGFGLPAVEAMAQGTPVVYCAEAVDEIALGSGIRVSDPDDADAFAAALAAAAASSSDEEGRRHRREIARRHTWDEVANRVIATLIRHGAPVLSG